MSMVAATMAALMLLGPQADGVRWKHPGGWWKWRFCTISSTNKISVWVKWQQRSGSDSIKPDGILFTSLDRTYDRMRWVHIAWHPWGDGREEASMVFKEGDSPATARWWDAHNWNEPDWGSKSKGYVSWSLTTMKGEAMTGKELRQCRVSQGSRFYPRGDDPVKELLAKN